MMKVTSKAGVKTCRVHRFTLPNLFLLPEPVAHCMVINVTRDSTHKYIVKGNKQSKYPINQSSVMVHG